MKAKALIAAGLLLICTSIVSFALAETTGEKQLRKKPDEFGSVVINNFSYGENRPPVVFKHWLHRSKYTCRLCHVDIGFGMQGGSTKMTCEDIKAGLYCGTCHNGKDAFGRTEKSVFGGGAEMCDKCHSYGKDVAFKYDFYEFRKPLPKERLGNGINWQVAEEGGHIKLKDFIEGVSFKHDKLKDPAELTLQGEEANMPDIIFSHAKHAKWSGCELCHPEIFGVKKGGTVYSMDDIFNGKYCGVCHDLVAFPNKDCQRCHTKEVY